MTCEGWKDLLMGYLDGELDDEQTRRLEAHLQSCETCRKELEGFRKLVAIADEVVPQEPEDKMWEQYWSGLYNRMERGVGWVLFGVAAIALLLYGAFAAIREFIQDPAVSLLLKIGVVAMLGGLVILFVSVLRERLFFWSRDRYKDVRR
jgi:anti-sigma factor RsiW